jgi:hypothetical protein
VVRQRGRPEHNHSMSGESGEATRKTRAPSFNVSGKC